MVSDGLAQGVASRAVTVVLLHAVHDNGGPYGGLLRLPVAGAALYDASRRLPVVWLALLCDNPALRRCRRAQRGVGPMANLALVREACDALSLNQRELGELLGLSTRTIQRLYAGKTSFIYIQWQKLARAAYPTHPDLASRLAAQGGSSLQALGLVKPAPPAPAPAAPLYDVQHLADGVVCAAAEAIDLAPRAIRPALLAAFRRARQMHLTVEELENALGEPASRKPAGGRRP